MCGGIVPLWGSIWGHRDDGNGRTWKKECYQHMVCYEMDHVNMVGEFYRAFGQEEHLAVPSAVASYSNMAPERVLLKLRLIAEEFAELVGACLGPAARREVEAGFERALEADSGERDIVGTADALGDLVYVIDGMALEAGIPLQDVFREIHASNMSKLGADGSPVIADGSDPAAPAGKILKGPGYFPPDIEGVLFHGAPRAQEE